MHRTILFPTLVMSLSPSISAQDAAQLVGTWNVISTPSSDFTVDAAKTGTSSAYVWLVSTSPTGEILVSVQGDTSFKSLKGRWNKESKTLTLEGHTVAIGGNKACWFKLTLDRKGELHGVRRYLDASPAFADFHIQAKKS